MELDKVTVKRLIDRLEKSGFVTRTTSETDRRANFVNLTESGTLLYDKGAADADNVLNEAYMNITENEYHKVFSVLEQIYANLKGVH